MPSCCDIAATATVAIGAAPADCGDVAHVSAAAAAGVRAMAGIASIEPNALRATHWALSAATDPSGEDAEPETHWAIWVGDPKCTEATLIRCKGLAFIGGDSALEGRPRFFSTRSEHTRLCSLQFVQSSSPVSAKSHRSFLSWHSPHAMRPRLRSLLKGLLLSRDASRSPSCVGKRVGVAGSSSPEGSMGVNGLLLSLSADEHR